MNLRLLMLPLAAGSFLLAACNREPPAAAATSALHEDHPPHGGTPVILGAGDYHLELVLDRKTGRLQAYVLDGEMDDFVRSSSPSITIAATSGDSSQQLTLAAVASGLTGETVGDTSLFEVQSDWLLQHPQFSGTLATIAIRGTSFSGVRFNVP